MSALELGVAVVGTIVPAPPLEEDNSSDEDDNANNEPVVEVGSDSQSSPSSSMNLDVSSMVALVADVSNGWADPELFLDPNLLRMAEEERRHPVMPVLQAAIQVGYPSLLMFVQQLTEHGHRTKTSLYAKPLGHPFSALSAILLVLERKLARRY